jgi:hypothetical protein
MWNDGKVKCTQLMFTLNAVCSPDKPPYVASLQLTAKAWGGGTSVCTHTQRTRDLLCGEWPAVSEAPTSSLTITNLLCEESFATSDIGNEWQAGHGPRVLLGGGNAISTNWTENACRRACVFSNDSDGT